MAISRLDMERQLRKDGGILTLDDAKKMAPPGEDLAYINKDEAALLKSLGGAGEDINGTGIKSYFLKKLVRKAKKAVKKVVKSPLGKAAILGGLTFGIPGTQFSGLAGGKGLGSFFGKGSFNPLKALITKGPQTGTFGTSGLGKLLGKFGLAEGTKLTGLGKIAGIGGLSGLAGLMAAGEQDEEDEIDFNKLDRGEGIDFADILARARKGDSEFRFLPSAQFTETYAEGGEVDKKMAMIKDMLIRGADDDLIKTMTGASQEEVDSVKTAQRQEKAEGGRIGYQEGELVEESEVVEESKGDNMLVEIAKVIFKLVPPTSFMFAAKDAYDMYQNLENEDKQKVQDIGKIGLRFAGLPGLAASAGMSLMDKFKGKEMAEGGIMDLGGNEMDLRGGGFVPLGAKEKADDVPARLSKNEFVMTADAVRAAGGGSVDKGADKMYKMMKNLEAQV